MTAFKAEPLTSCAVYRLTPSAPHFVKRIEEGNIAYYGLILQSEYDEAIREYLLEQSKDGLWEYQEGYGVTAEDSALVIEGLLESGAAPDVLRHSMTRLVERYYCEAEGGFKTVLEGRARYWRGVSVETTAHVAYLLHRIAPNAYRHEIQSCVRYLHGQQQPDGHWTGRWFPSVMIPTYYSARFLASVDGPYSQNVRRAVDFICDTQQEDANWSDSVIDTSAAILALDAAGAGVRERAEARRWLPSREEAAGWPGELVLYYWFEERDDRIFFSCMDKGQITTAWARLALRGGNMHSAG